MQAVAGVSLLPGLDVREGVLAVHACERPEVVQHHLAAQAGIGQRRGVQPTGGLLDRRRRARLQYIEISRSDDRLLSCRRGCVDRSRRGVAADHNCNHHTQGSHHSSRAGERPAASHHPPVVDVDESLITSVESVITAVSSGHRPAVSSVITAVSFVIAVVSSVIASVPTGEVFVPPTGLLESSPHAAKPITAMAVITTTRFNPFTLASPRCRRRRCSVATVMMRAESDAGGARIETSPKLASPLIPTALQHPYGEQREQRHSTDLGRRRRTDRP